MSNTLAQTALRLDLARGPALVEPVVERRGRRWDLRQAEDASEVVSAEPTGGAAAALAQEPSRSQPGRQAASKMLSGMVPEAMSNAQNEADTRTEASALPETPQRKPERETVGISAKEKDQNEQQNKKTTTPNVGPAGLPQAQHKVPARPSSSPDRRPEPSAAPRQPQQVVAAPNVKLAGFPDATAEHTASRALTATDPDGDNQDVSGPRNVARRFPRATLASDSPAQPGVAASQNGSGSITSSGTDAGSSGSREQGVSDGLTTPVRILSKPLPRYPAQALEQQIQGDVLVDVEFRYSGTLEILGVRRGLSPRLNESALEAARKIRFLPARRDGRPVDTQATVRIRFQLEP